MRILISTLVLCSALAWPGVVSAAPQDRLAQWQIDGSPVFFDGSYYCPAGATVYFDPNLHVISGEVDGVPLIVDITMEPYSVVYAPVGGRQLKPYTRPRVGNLAGTTGSRSPEFPVALSAEADQIKKPSDALATCGQWVSPDVEVPPGFFDRSRREALNEEYSEFETLPPIPPNGIVRSAALPLTNDGIWIQFEGARWAVSQGAAQFDPSRFTQIGEYRGSPVYRLRGDDVLWEMFVRPAPGAFMTRYVKIER